MSKIKLVLNEGSTRKVSQTRGSQKELKALAGKYITLGELDAEMVKLGYESNMDLYKKAAPDSTFNLDKKKGLAAWMKPNGVVDTLGLELLSLPPAKKNTTDQCVVRVRKVFPRSEDPVQSGKDKGMLHAGMIKTHPGMDGDPLKEEHEMFLNEEFSVKNQKALNAFKGKEMTLGELNKEMVKLCHYSNAEDLGILTLDDLDGAMAWEVKDDEDSTVNVIGFEVIGNSKDPKILDDTEIKITAIY